VNIDLWLDRELVRLRIRFVETLSGWMAVRPTIADLETAELSDEQMSVLRVAIDAERAYDERRRELGLL
jgi:hypothetical protein